MNSAKNKCHSSSFIVFRKVLAGCFLCCLHTFTCLGYLPLLGAELKDSLNSRHPIDTLVDLGSDYAYFNRFNSALLHSHNRFDDFISKHVDPNPYTIEVSAPFNPGCLCLGDPLFVRASLNSGPIKDITSADSKKGQFYYDYTSYTNTISRDESLTARGILDELLAFIPKNGRGYVKDLLTSSVIDNQLILKAGPLTTSMVNNGTLVGSFGQSVMDMVRLMFTISGQEMYLKLIEGGGTVVKTMVQGIIDASGLKIPNPFDSTTFEPFFKPMVNEIMSGQYKPIGYSVPINFYSKHEHHDLTAMVPYTRPVYKKPKPISTTIELIPSEPVYIKPWSVAKYSLFVPYGKSVQFTANLPDEDPADGIVSHKWVGFPSITALGFGRAIGSNSDNISPFTVTMDSPFWQSGLYGLIAYRGPAPPIGCMRMSEWTEVNVGCRGDASDREGLIKLEGDYDFSEFFIFDLSGKSKRTQEYEPIVCEGEDITIVSGGTHSAHQCEYTYEWYGPGRILKEGTTTNEYVWAPNVLIGQYQSVEVDILDKVGGPSGQKATIKRPINNKEEITIRNMTPEMSGVYTRIASRTGKGVGVNSLALGCSQCFRKAVLTITVKPSPPKLTSNAPVCEGEDLVISISPTTNDPTEYKWAHKNSPSDPDPVDPLQWSAWSTDREIKRTPATVNMSGVYLVKAQNRITYPGKGRGGKDGTDEISTCESVNPVTITVEVKKNVHVNLSLSKNTVYAGRESILTASLSGTDTAPAGGITITLKDSGGSAISGTDYVPVPGSMYIPANGNSVSTTITTKWTKPATGDLSKTVILAGSITNGITPSDKTCYVIPELVTLVINPLFKPELTNGPVSPICSGDIVHIELSSTLLGTTYEWTASKGIGNVSGASRGSSSTIHEKLTNNDLALSGTVVYTITPRVEDPEDPGLLVDGEPTSLTVTVMPISKKVVAPVKQTSEDALSFNWLPENPPQTNTTYRWYTHANKTGVVIQEGKAASGNYSIPTPKPGKYKYYITSQEDGYCENEATEIELTAVHHIQLTFDKPEVQQGENTMLTARLSGAVIAPDGGITITLNETGSSAEKGIHYDGLLPAVYIPKGSNSVSITIMTDDLIAMDVDKALVIKGHANDYIIKEAAALTITRNTDNNKITLTFNEPTVDGGRVAKLTASLPPNIRAGHQITIHLHKDDLASQALVSKNYEDLQMSITIPRGDNVFTIDAFTAKNNCIIDGSTTLTLRGAEPVGYEIQKPNPAITIFDRTGDDSANREITLDFEFKEVRGSETGLLKICLPNCVTSVNPIHIRLRKRKTAFLSEAAKKDINYKKFSWDVTIPAKTNCTSILVHTLLDRNSDIKTLWLTGKVTDPRFHINSTKVNIITPKILVPNVFTPNGDGHHDIWEIHNLDLYRSCTVNIFNRWGQLVFTSIGYPEEQGWDGTNHLRPLPVGAYFYIIDLKDGSLPLRGYVSIIR